MSISGLSSDTTISQTKFYLDEVRKVAGEANSTPTTTIQSTNVLTDTNGTAQARTANVVSSVDSYNVYIKSDLSNVAGHGPGSTSASQPGFSIPSAGQSSTSPVNGAGSYITPASDSAGSDYSIGLFSGSSNSAQNASFTQTNGQSSVGQMTNSTQNTGDTQDTTAVQDSSSDDMKAYSLLVSDLNMLASLIQSGDMPNAKTTAGTVIKDLNHYLSVPSQNHASANVQTPKFVVQNFGSLLASVQEGDKTSASTIINAIKILT